MHKARLTNAQARLSLYEYHLQKHALQSQTGEILAHLNYVKCTKSRNCHVFHKVRKMEKTHAGFEQ